ncbi:hypothetical protein FIV42_08280 [Persicimonas caeni]|uniref:Uncharacterized protein n=1 Tax=Persicimonas caeni TaxID=2292766 RepID=A0A4Y6PQY1_PERCE|nr:hypothetical protein [Persicimonas caeni]QDG50726.1 hypothetical protein FIV42_08280 [Persicimonas caeni]QED31947.1 hypothetical protein FRD00_08275 [Persicimonas caeni]
MNQKAHDSQQTLMLQLPSSSATAAHSLAVTGMSGEEFLHLIRERERYNWLADKVDRWVGLYSVPELVEMLNSMPTMPGQRQKALVALSLTDDLSALAALESFDSSGRAESFQALHQIAIGQWRQRQRTATN